jgi:sugar phosphate isomerase/epimerase
MRRRHFLALPGGAAALLATPNPNLQIGVTDWNLGLAGKLEALDLAAEIGFAGVEVSLGRKPIEGKLPFNNPAAHIERAKTLKLTLVSTCLDILHINGLKNDKLGEKWLSDAIDINQALGVRNMLLPFFGPRALETQKEMDYVADLLRNIAPKAEKAQVTFGLENTNSAAENLRILERAKSNAVRVFYDVGNSFSRGHDIYKEIPLLGRDRICQFHLKDNPSLLGQGGIHFPTVLSLIEQIGYRGFADLETSSPSRNIAADMARNLGYLRSLVSA